MEAIRNADRQAFANQSGIQTLFAELRNLQSLQTVLKQGAANFCCRLLPRSKGQRLMQTLQNYNTKQLDIRRIMSNSIALQDLLSSFLSKRQKALLAHQKSRVAQLN